MEKGYHQDARSWCHMSTGLFTEVKLKGNSLSWSAGRVHTPVPQCHVDSLWYVYWLSFCRSRSVFFRHRGRNAGWSVESRLPRYVLVLACCWLPLKGQGMCGMQLNMSVWGLRHKVTWASQQLPWFEMTVMVIIVWSSVIMITSYQTEKFEVSRQTDRLSLTIQCCVMVMQNSSSFSGFEGVTSVI